MQTTNTTQEKPNVYHIWHGGAPLNVMKLHAELCGQIDAVKREAKAYEEQIAILEQQREAKAANFLTSLEPRPLLRLSHIIDYING